jgi:hypothetical protein
MPLLHWTFGTPSCRQNENQPWSLLFHIAVLRYLLLLNATLGDNLYIITIHTYLYTIPLHFVIFCFRCAVLENIARAIITKSSCGIL